TARKTMSASGCSRSDRCARPRCRYTEVAMTAIWDSASATSGMSQTWYDTDSQASGGADVDVDEESRRTSQPPDQGRPSDGSSRDQSIRLHPLRVVDIGPPPPPTCES